MGLESDVHDDAKLTSSSYAQATSAYECTHWHLAILTANGPEQIWLRVRARLDDTPIGKHDGRSEHIVDRKAMFPTERTGVRGL